MSEPKRSFDSAFAPHERTATRREKALVTCGVELDTTERKAYDDMRREVFAITYIHKELKALDKHVRDTLDALEDVAKHNCSHAEKHRPARFSGRERDRNTSRIENLQRLVDFRMPMSGVARKSSSPSSECVFIDGQIYCIPRPVQGGKDDDDDAPGDDSYVPPPECDSSMDSSDDDSDSESSEWSD